MILMGDEVGRTQKGNNNGYCQDNNLSWFDWSSVEREPDLLSFVKKLIHFSQSLQIFNLNNLLEVGENMAAPHLTWHGIRAGEPDWSESSRSLAFELHHPQAGENLYIIFNAYWKPLSFELPQLEQGKSWKRIVDTSLLSPDDFCCLEVAPVLKNSSYQAQARSSVVLLAQTDELSS